VISSHTNQNLRASKAVLQRHFVNTNTMSETVVSHCKIIFREAAHRSIPFVKSKIK